MSPEIWVSLVAIMLALVLAVRNLRSFGLSFKDKAWMAVAWLVIIAVIAVVAERFSV